MEKKLFTGALHGAKRISSNFDSKFKTLETTFLNAGYPKRFSSHTVKSFLEDLSRFLFEERKKIFITFPYCNRNEGLSKNLKKFISELNKFTGFKYIFIVLWQTRRIKSLFNLKDKNIHRSQVVYKRDCSCGDNYIGDTMRNVEVRTDEDSNPCNDSEPAHHLRENPSHSFSWRILCTAHSFHKRRITEGLMIQQWGPSLNKQVHSYVAKLIPSGISLTYKNMHIADGLFTLKMTFN